jgi:hypothetical protein
MTGDKRARLKQWLASGEVRLQPLSFPQRELWEASAVPVADTANHICCIIELRGLVTPDECRDAVQRVVERQEVMRLSFLPGKDGPLQMIRRSSEANIRFRDLSPARGQPDAVEELARGIFSEPFDLTQGPLYRAEMLHRAADDHVLVLAIHHTIADGWTLGVFVRDLCGAYLQGMMKKREALTEVPLSYTAWGAAERAFWQPAELEKRAAFWKSALAGARRLFTHPDPQEAPANQANGTSADPRDPRDSLAKKTARATFGTSAGGLHRSVFHIPAELGNAARELARRSGATLFSTLLTAFQAALSRWTGADDIVVGTPVANRNKPAIRETMGYCSGNVPLRGQVDGARPFSDALRAVQQTTVDAFANAMPFAELARALGDSPASGRHPVYDVRFALQNHPIPDATLPSFSARLRMRATGTARFDLGCEITEDDEALEVVWLRRENRFTESDILELDRLFHTILAGACRSPERRTALLI